MKKIIIFIPVLFFLTLFTFNARDVFASSCTQSGSTTFCDDGTSYTQSGNTTFGSDGTSYTQSGNTTFGSNGTSCTRSGSTTFCSDGTSYTQSGSSIFGSDGSSYTQSGNTTFGSSGGNIYNSCPVNSSANSSGKCSCNYGYSVNSNKTSCVYTGTYTAPTTSTCPLNSYSNGTGSCTCNYGYSVSGGSCVPITQICQNKYGYNSYGSGTSCYCSTGYQWNSSKTSCVVTPTQPSSISSPTLAFSSIDTNLSYGSSGAEVTKLQNFLIQKGFLTGQVSGNFFSITKKAVIAYQTSVGLPASGFVGSMTRAKINSDSTAAVN